jgi:hypothetical protein
MSFEKKNVQINGPCFAPGDTKVFSYSQKVPMTGLHVRRSAERLHIIERMKMNVYVGALPGAGNYRYRLTGDPAVKKSTKNLHECDLGTLWSSGIYTSLTSSGLRPLIKSYSLDNSK